MAPPSSSSSRSLSKHIHGNNNNSLKNIQDMTVIASSDFRSSGGENSSEADSVEKPASMSSVQTFDKLHSNINKSAGNNARNPGEGACSCCYQITYSRTFVLRTLLTLSLLVAVAVCTFFSYGILRESEREVGRQTYESIAASALTGAQAIALRKLQGSQVIATLMSHIQPNKADWPLIEFDGYIPVASAVAELSSSGTQSLMVFVNPDETPVPVFEDHTKMVYEKQGRPEDAGVNDHGFGVWRPDPLRPDSCEFDDCRVSDHSSETDWGGKYNIQANLMFHNVAGAGSLLFNIYSLRNRGVHIESMFDCVGFNNEADSTEEAYPSCAVVTDILELAIRPGPAALIFNPILPANDPTEFVGFATTSVHWEETLTSVVPDYVNGLTCVVSTDTTSVTYEIRNGQPVFLGLGDLHDTEYTDFARTTPLNTFVTGAGSSANYTLTVYPTDEMFDTFVTNSPIKVAVGFFGVVAFCTCMFFLYDFLMRHEAQQRRNILEMKRRFVRFISHEIRTPLNTVCMGLELLESELKMAPDKEDAMGEGVDKEDIDFWSNVTNDIKENAHTAVEILNDMLNYDKLESGGLNLELTQVRVSELVERTVRQFQIQAVNRRVNLKLNIAGYDENGESSNGDGNNNKKDLEAGGLSAAAAAWTIIGDDVRLGQVMRNLISNALKFTPAEGVVDVSAHYVPNGLPDAKTMCMAEDECGECAYVQPRDGSIRIVVKDSGIGLTKDQLSQLFREGVQFDANKLQHGGGSGLGLSIAKGIVEQHSGNIVADSEGVGHGTSFTIELPLYKYRSARRKLKNKDDTTITTSSVTDRSEDMPVPKRILVVEDAVSSLKMLIRLLERAGHSCVGAANGQEAIDRIQEDIAAKSANTSHVPFDTILIDFEMPLVNGPTATTEIRNMGYEATIVGVTGNVLSEDVQKFKDAGANEVLAKPISMARIDAYWQREKQRLGSSIRRSYTAVSMTGQVR
eukprot:CAMPEP_0117003880 /NCGR_PEP_ID=MMETSP0472-20121206/5054_1 /TAXON_ID=693140 ORGANISM="Tiarina fusus, Strain LIS" /NCGR_SAMPLE_ID=MMETSP0472 /ASSEMBLY_ACC=CAM_ASM_000603 /LENGTH=969 /DNA_ID=CAMNT_0004704679 /DNA_START=62 /DNA_END=2971 /DNA_ORIENTATION=+